MPFKGVSPQLMATSIYGQVSRVVKEGLAAGGSVVLMCDRVPGALQEFSTSAWLTNEVSPEEVTLRMKAYFNEVECIKEEQRRQALWLFVDVEAGYLNEMEDLTSIIAEARPHRVKLGFVYTRSEQQVSGISQQLLTTILGHLGGGFGLIEVSELRSRLEQQLR